MLSLGRTPSTHSTTRNGPSSSGTWPAATICRAEVEGLQETAALLAETTIAPPSAGLRARILADISTVRPLPPEIGPEHAPSGGGVATVTALEPRRRRRVTTFLAAAAAAVVLAGGAVVAVQQLGDEGQPDRFSAISQAPDAHSYKTVLGDGVSATVTVSKKRNEAYISTTGMPPAPTDKQYVLWLRHGGLMTQAGVMPEGENNKVLLSGDAATADGAAVSIENAGTPPVVPSDDVVASFTFDA